MVREVRVHGMGAAWDSVGRGIGEHSAWVPPGPISPGSRSSSAGTNGKKKNKTSVQLWCVRTSRANKALVCLHEVLCTLQAQGLLRPLDIPLTRTVSLIILLTVSSPKGGSFHHLSSLQLCSLALATVGNLCISASLHPYTETLAHNVSGDSIWK